MNLNPITVAEALPIVADEMGIDLESNRAEALLWLNRIRNLWYFGFTKRKLFDDLLECLPVCCHCVGCMDCGCEQYRGFTLPAYMSGPVSAWASTEPTTLRSRWFDKFAGRHSGSVEAFLITELNGVFPMENDIFDGTKILVASTSSKDDGKEITIQGVDCNGKAQKICMRLEGDGTVTTTVELKLVTNIVLPCLCGEVILKSEIDGRILSTYDPSTPRVPRFRRFRVDSPCPNPCTVLVQANRRFRDLFSDDDIVEIGDRLVLEHGASYFRFSRNTTDSKELQRANMDRSEMINLIQGMVEREDGGHIQDGPIVLRGRRTAKPRLPGYRH